HRQITGFMELALPDLQLRYAFRAGIIGGIGLAHGARNVACKPTAHLSLKRGIVLADRKIHRFLRAVAAEEITNALGESQLMCDRLLRGNSRCVIDANAGRIVISEGPAAAIRSCEISAPVTRRAPARRMRTNSVDGMSRPG